MSTQFKFLLVFLGLALFMSLTPGISFAGLDLVAGDIQLDEGSLKIGALAALGITGLVLVARKVKSLLSS